jgi:hypothetical protein
MIPSKGLQDALSERAQEPSIQMLGLVLFKFD